MIYANAYYTLYVSIDSQKEKTVLLVLSQNHAKHSFCIKAVRGHFLMIFV